MSMADVSVGVCWRAIKKAFICIANTSNTHPTSTVQVVYNNTIWSSTAVFFNDKDKGQYNEIAQNSMTTNGKINIMT